MKSKEHLYEMISKMERDRGEYLKRLFKNMPEETAKEFTYIEVEKNKYLIQAGKPCETVYFILKGNVRGIDYLKTGRALSFMDFSRMYIIGDFEAFSGHQDSCISVCTAEKCKLLKISVNNYLRWIQHDENALLLRLENILKILLFEKKSDREYLVMGCTDRLVSFLVRFYERESKSPEVSVKIDFTQTELADKIGFNVRSVQRSIASLEEKAMISVTKGKIVMSAGQYALLKEREIEKERRN